MDAFADRNEFLASAFPLVGIVVAAVVAQFVGEVLLLVDGALFGGAGGEGQQHRGAKDDILDFHLTLLYDSFFTQICVTI